MRRELIVISLGFLCVWTLWSLLYGFITLNTEKMLIDTVMGLVGAGNFSYWQLGHSGPLLIELTSIKGDADLYISDKTRPTYEIDGNNFSSVTCGLDVVEIPSEFPRPIGIGVFGHWTHNVSEYSIQVFLNADAFFTEKRAMREEQQRRQYEEEEGAVDGEEAEGREPDRRAEEEYSESDYKQSQERSPPRRSDEKRKPHFLRLLNIFDMIIEMFVY